ncbi:fungal pheromone STE3G-protein-coupled receptor [Peniophora sp. CONT]|nr:fungal pheromone STE3G-protein-coupled receptor [Peniophora sp. CONT]
MGASADPTYPLLPVACFISSAMLLLLLLTSFARQRWNLGLAFLCFWLFLENLTTAVNLIIWSDNADVKLYVYCDIVTHLQMIAFVVKPMATLIITRRLFLIASLQSVEAPSKAALPDPSVGSTIISGISSTLIVVQDYVNQGSRFQVKEVFGCTNAADFSIAEILLIESWSILPSIIASSVSARVALVFYRQRKDINRFLRSNGSGVTRTSYLRILLLASIDVLLTLPIGIANTSLAIKSGLDQNLLTVYPGWKLLHTGWAPASIPYRALKADGVSTLARFYFSYWSSPVLAFVIFGLFGLTPEARASYKQIIFTVGGWFGWKPTLRARDARSELGTMEFGERPLEISFATEAGCVVLEIDRLADYQD